MYHFVSAPCWGRAVALMIDGCFHSFIVIMSLSFVLCFLHVTQSLSLLSSFVFAPRCSATVHHACPAPVTYVAYLACCLLLLSVRSRTYSCHHVSLSCAGYLPVPGSSSVQLGTDWCQLIPGIGLCVMRELLSLVIIS